LLFTSALVWAQSASATVQTNSARASKITRTADGHPDLSAVWNARTATPLERPKNLGTKEFYTDGEFEAISKRLHAGDTTVPLPRNGGGEGGGTGVNVQYGHDLFGFKDSESNYGWNKRTSLIVGPEGSVPPLLPEAKQRIAAEAAERRGHEFDSYKSLNLETRCILSVRQQIPYMPIEDSNVNFEIVQGRGYVAIYQELNHDTRVIPTDGRAHLPPSMRLLQGDSVGHWDGDTLVVDTTNFTNRTTVRGSDENLHLIERFNRVSEDRLLYSFTVEDRTTWDKPWSVEVPWVRNTKFPLYEYACSEGNEAIPITLGGARQREAEAAQKGANRK
jgi:hypothetical protein